MWALDYQVTKLAVDADGKVNAANRATLALLSQIELNRLNKA